MCLAFLIGYALVQMHKCFGAFHLWRPKNWIFDPPPSVHLSPHEPNPLPLWTSKCGPHEIHIALLKRLVHWPSGPIAEIRLYDCNLFKTVLLVIYITNLYRRKFSLFIPPKDEILVKKTPTSLHEKKTWWHQWTLFNFRCGRPHGAWPHLPPSTCVHLSLTPLSVSVWTS